MKLEGKKYLSQHMIVKCIESTTAVHGERVHDPPLVRSSNELLTSGETRLRL